MTQVRMMSLPAGVLEGRFIRLEPYSEANRAQIGAALDCDPEAWSLVNANGRGEAFAGWWAMRMADTAAGTGQSYAIRRLADDRVVGVSSYLNLRHKDHGVEIGATFLHPDARSGPVNPEAKLLMLGAIFAQGAVRVEIITDARNLRSAAAIAKLGAVREAVLRQHKITWTGYVRDSVVFSILDKEWPAVKAGLEARLDRHAHPQAEEVSRNE